MSTFPMNCTGIVSSLVLFLDVSVLLMKEPWKSFLTELREGLEEWAGSIELPYDLKDLTAVDAAEEIRIILGYVLRRNETRSAYLDRLAELGQIPLKASSDESRGIAERLRSSGRSEAEIRRILGADTSSHDGGVL